MEFTTQRELLEYLGKNWEDRGLVQRMIIRWEVYKENGMYILVNKDEKIRVLSGRVKELEEEIRNLNEKYGSIGDVDEIKENVAYYEWLYESEKSDKEYRIRKCYDWIRRNNIRANWDEFNEWIMGDEQD